MITGVELRLNICQRSDTDRDWIFFLGVGGDTREKHEPSVVKHSQRFHKNILKMMLLKMMIFLDSIYLLFNSNMTEYWFALAKALLGIDKQSFCGLTLRGWGWENRWTLFLEFRHHQHPRFVSGNRIASVFFCRSQYWWRLYYSHLSLSV